MKANKYIIVLYNGIEDWLKSEENIAQALNHIHSNAIEKIQLISFEHSYVLAMKSVLAHQNNPRFDITIFKNNCVNNYFSLLWGARKLKKIISTFSSYSLDAQGPLAGFICIKAHNPTKCTHITINASSIFASEHEYKHQDESSIFKKWWHSWHIKQLQKIETTVYSFTKKSSIVSIHTVSSALKEFLFNTYGAQPQRIYVQADTAAVINAQDKEFFKIAVRTELNVSQQAHVYCFKGNYTTHEHPEEIISFFKQQRLENEQAFLLILSQDKDMFEIALRKNQIPFESYHIKSIDQANAYRYLAACDTGIIFRDLHIVHWISKPIVALEYKAAGLEIIHNNTIAYVTKQTQELPPELKILGDRFGDSKQTDLI